MTAITVTLSDRQFQKLEELAKKHGLSPEDIVRFSLQEWLDSEEEFSEIIGYVLNKNAELYHRLT